MRNDDRPKSRWHFGRSWWMTILTIAVEALLGVIAVHQDVPPEKVAVPAVAVAAACASHNFGRAWEDGKRNANQNSPTQGDPPFESEVPE